MRKPPSPCDAQTSVGFLSIGRLTTTHLKRQPTPNLRRPTPEPLTPFLIWQALEEAISTLHCLAIQGQKPSLRRIRHLRPPRPRPFLLLRVECPLILLGADTKRRDHLLLHPLNHQYVALQLRGPGLQALESHLDIHSLIPKPLSILSILPTCHRNPSSNGLWSPYHPSTVIHIVESDHFILSYILTSRSCDNSRSFGIHLDCSRGTISSTL